METIQVDGVIFDFDGVIVDSSAAVEAQWRKFADHFILDAEELLATVHGRRSKDVVAEWLPPSEVDRAAHYFQATRFDHRELPMVLGAADALTAVSASRWAVASSARKEILNRWFGDCWPFRPAALISSADVARGKPDPECYLKAADALGVKASESVVVEDAPAGIEAANRAGIGTVIAVQTTHGVDSLTGATITVPDMTSIRFVREGDRVRVSW